MAAKNYCEKDQLIARLIAENATPSEQDTQVMEMVVEGVSRAIEAWCGRRFYAVVDEVRYYTAEFSDELFIDDCLAVKELKTDEDGDRVYEVTWASSDFDLLPENAALEKTPYTLLATAPDGKYAFPVGVRRGVKVIGTFGYAEVTPGQVREAALIQCARIFKRRDTPFGVAGNADLGELRVIPKLDQDVEWMLTPLKRVV